MYCIQLTYQCTMWDHYFGHSYLDIVPMLCVLCGFVIIAVTRRNCGNTTYMHPQRTRISNRQELLGLWGEPDSLTEATLCDTGVHWAKPGREDELQQVIREFAELAVVATGFCVFALQRPLPEDEQTKTAFRAPHIHSYALARTLYDSTTLCSTGRHSITVPTSSKTLQLVCLVWTDRAEARMQDADNSHSFETKVFWRSDAERVAWRASWAGGELSMRGRAAARLDRKRSGMQTVHASWPAWCGAAL